MGPLGSGTGSSGVVGVGSGSGDGPRRMSHVKGALSEDWTRLTVPSLLSGVPGKLAFAGFPSGFLLLCFACFLAFLPLFGNLRGWSVVSVLNHPCVACTRRKTRGNKGNGKMVAEVYGDVFIKYQILQHLSVRAAARNWMCCSLPHTLLFVPVAPVE